MTTGEPTHGDAPVASQECSGFEANEALTLAHMLLRRLRSSSSTALNEADFDRLETDDGRAQATGGRWENDPDVIAAVVLFGNALGQSPHLLKRLEDGPIVLILEVGHADWIDPVATAVRSCLKIDPASSDPGPPRGKCTSSSDACHPPPIVVEARGTSFSQTEYRDRKVTQAFREHRTLIGVTASQGRGLPRDVMEACEERLTLDRFDPSSLALVVDHVVGRTPDRRIPAEIAAAVEPRDLRIALHPDRGANGSVDRLVALIGKRLQATKTIRSPKLEELAGFGPAHAWGLATAADLAAYAKGKLGWSECEPGILLAGPPGTGKTMFAGAMARQADVGFIAGSLAQWQSAGEAHLGTTLKAMRDFFEAARKAAPCIALIDELDSFGDRRRFSQHDRHYSTQVVNGLLECLDGEGGRAGVVLVGTTNAPERIDPAILRSGRFDRCMVIPLPSLDDLAAILRHHLKEDLAEVDLRVMARRALGGTGADCAAWVRRARSRARRLDRRLEISDLVIETEAVNGPQSDDGDLRVAVHECGHAVVAHALGIGLEAIALHGAGGGSTAYVPGCEYGTRNSLHDRLAIYLAGRAAEILVFGAPSAGAATDLAQATELCRNMHARWGLGRWITVNEGRQMSRDVLLAVERNLRQASEKAASLLTQHRSGLDRLIEILLERRALDGPEAETILRTSKLNC